MIKALPVIGSALFLASATALFLASPLNADIVTLIDYGNGTGSQTIPDFYNLQSGSCGAIVGGYRTCTGNDGFTGLFSQAILQAPVATTVVPGTIYIGDPSGNVSDEIMTTLQSPLSCGNLPPASCGDYFLVQTITFNFGLDRTASPLSCLLVSGGCLTYTGQVQDVGTIVYGSQPAPVGPRQLSPLTLDFQYTPEPGEFVPLAIGLGLTWFAIRRSRRVI